MLSINFSAAKFNNVQWLCRMEFCTRSGHTILVSVESEEIEEVSHMDLPVCSVRRRLDR